MSLPLLIVALFAVVVIASAIACACFAPCWTLLQRVPAIFALTSVNLFSAFGFMASFEPGEDHHLWRGIYALVFLASTVGIGRLALSRQVSSN